MSCKSSRTSRETNTICARSTFRVVLSNRQPRILRDRKGVLRGASIERHCGGVYFLRRT